MFKPAYSNKGKCFLIHKNKPLSYSRARKTVVTRLKEVCGDSNLGLHSKSRGASLAARAPINDIVCWKRHGRCKSDMAKDGYVLDSLEQRLEVTKQLKL